MRRIVCCIAALLLTPTLFASASNKPDLNFTLSNPAKVPGMTLEAGSYSIHVVNRLSDRLIVRVDALKGNTHAMFLGIPNSRIARPAQAGVVNWNSPADGTEALRGIYFPGAATVVEFVYPKADAVALAQANHATVAAVDPASEGKVTDSSLSQEDMQLLTLWLLTPQEVGPDGKPGITAARYETASMQKPVIKSLPHTASDVPWVLLAGLSSLMGVAVLRRYRMLHGAAVVTNSRG